MLTKRIIPCLDVKDGRTVKGINFINLQDLGDPVALARQYAEQGADELVLLDITATIERRTTFLNVVREVASTINIPFTVGGGISAIKDVELLLKNGADKVSINTAAYKNPSMIGDMRKAFGSQCIVLAIDTRREADGLWYVYLNGGRNNTGRLTTEWAAEAVELGAGEILLTSMNNDGTRKGFALDITGVLSASLPVPVIASGGAGTLQHFDEVFSVARADAALAAGIFHRNEISIPVLKNYLKDNNIAVRI